jgi:hypothetical protein
MNEIGKVQLGQLETVQAMYRSFIHLFYASIYTSSQFASTQMHEPNL